VNIASIGRCAALAFVGIALAAPAAPGVESHGLVPLPAAVAWQQGTCPLGHVIRTDAALRNEALQLVAMLQPATGIEFKLASLDDSAAAEAAITLRQDPALAAKSPEAYRLSVTPAGVTIVGASPAGVYYGVQTLRQLLPLQVFAKSRQTGVTWTIPCVEITDQPRFAWRSFMLDCARHFLDADYVKRHLDLMAMHKLNTFHWHLADDEGFRIEIKSYPKLTAVGSHVRQGDDQHAPGETIAPHAGFFSQQQIREIVAYAAARHINIVPEIDIPGHSGAAAAAYPEILCHDKHGRALSGNVWCASREENYRMLEAIVGELVELFPCRYVHVGGDEVNQSIWPQCPHCRALMAKEKIASAGQLQAHFIRRYEEILRKHGRKMIGWNEILADGLSKDSAIMSWQDENPGYVAIGRGVDVVFAPGPYCYVDMKESPQDPWGMMWAGAVSLAKMYSFNPLARASVTPAQQKHILGVEACMWAEFLGSQQRADYKIWPRLCALAEVGWTPQPRRNFPQFMDRLGPDDLARLSLLGVKYRVPEAALRTTEDGAVEVTPPFAGAVVRYTLDGAQPTADSPRWLSGPIKLRAGERVAAAVFAADSRMSRVVQCGVGPRLKATVQTTMPAYQDHTPDKLLDGDTSTFFWRDGNGKAGDALTITFPQPRKLALVEFRSGMPDAAGRDIIVSGTLLASSDGKDFHAIAEFQDGVARAKLAGESIKSLRIRVNADQPTWLILQDPIVK
jgi:hexosaminidase